VTVVRPAGRLRALLTALAGLGLMLALAVAQVQTAPSAQAAGGERILSFTASYNLAANGSMGVTETLVWQFGPGEHHGIKATSR